MQLNWHTFYTMGKVLCTVYDYLHSRRCTPDGGNCPWTWGYARSLKGLMWKLLNEWEAENWKNIWFFFPLDVWYCKALLLSNSLNSLGLAGNNTVVFTFHPKARALVHLKIRWTTVKHHPTKWILLRKSNRIIPSPPPQFFSTHLSIFYLSSWEKPPSIPGFCFVEHPTAAK